MMKGRTRDRKKEARNGERGSKDAREMMKARTIDRTKDLGQNHYTFSLITEKGRNEK